MIQTLTLDAKEAILHGNRIHGCRNRKHLYNTHERIQIMRTQTDIHFEKMVVVVSPPAYASCSLPYPYTSA